MGVQVDEGEIVLGYWKIRGLAAPARMMLQYSEVPYKEKIFEAIRNEDGSYNKDQWFKDTKEG